LERIYFETSSRIRGDRMRIREAIQKVVEGIDLSEDEAYELMQEVMRGEATPAQIAGLITALRMKGESVEEIAGFARAMRDNAVKVDVDEYLIDTCGTGGDMAGTFNISTAVAFVAAGGGVKVAKHGNRSVSSKCGSADLMEALGIRIDLPPEVVRDCIKEIGIGFIFAPLFHPAMRHAMGPRRELGIRTVFNILGPLTNPAGVRAQLLGVGSPELTEKMASVLRRLGVERAFVVHGMDGLDEATITGKSIVSELSGGEIRTYEIEPEMFGMKRGSIFDIAGGTPEENARTVIEVLRGARGPKRDIVLLNSAFALMAAGVAESIEDGIEVAAESIDSGAAIEKLFALKARVGGVQPS
jgi:anthranilate phosphoribosyltransferase